MNLALILAAGVGQRMRNAGLPKQFLNVMGKPIIIYTLEKFDQCDEIDGIIVVCHMGYVDYLQDMVKRFQLKKIIKIIVGGNDRQSSIRRGLGAVEDFLDENNVPYDNSIVVIHDGVRPLIEESIISENVYSAKKYGCAITVHAVKESVIITGNEDAGIDEFKEREKTYTMTSPQTFKLELLQKSFDQKEIENYNGMPLLDAAMVYAKTIGKVHLVKEQGLNIKITTPEDFYYLKAILELEEQKHIFGL